MNIHRVKIRVKEITHILQFQFHLSYNAIHCFKKASAILVEYCQKTEKPFHQRTCQEWLSTYQHWKRGNPTEQRKYRSYQRCVFFARPFSPKLQSLRNFI